MGTSLSVVAGIATNRNLRRMSNIETEASEDSEAH